MRYTFYGLVVAGFMGFAPWCTAQDIPTAHLDGAHFNESLRKEAPVSGEDVVGLIIKDTSKPVGAAQIFVRVPHETVTEVCIEVASIAGDYVASNPYILPSVRPGTYVLIPVEAQQPTGTGYRQRFERASLDQFATVARRGKCTERSNDLLPLAWGGPPHSPDAPTLAVAVQSGRSAASILVNGDAQRPQSCVGLTEGVRTEFDSICTFSLLEVPPHGLTLQLQRCAFDDCTRAPPVNLLL